MAPPGLCTLPFSLQPPSPALRATRSFLTQANWAQLYFPDPMRVTRKPRTPVGLPLSQHPTLRAPSEGNWRTSHHCPHCHPGPLQGSRLAAVISSLGTPCTLGGTTSHNRSWCPGSAPEPVTPGGLVTVGSAGRPLQGVHQAPVRVRVRVRLDPKAFCLPIHLSFQPVS